MASYTGFNPYGAASAPPIHHNPDDWTLASGIDCRHRIICLTVGIALAAVAAVAAYFCLVNGLSMLDMARTSLARFGAGFLIYSGVAFSVVAVGNALYVGGKLLLCDDGKKFRYSPGEARIQVALSILAPIAAIPGIIVLGLGMAIRR